MKNIYITIILSIILIAFPHSSYSQEFFIEQEDFQQVTINKDSDLLRSRLTGVFQNMSENRYRLEESGEGDYGKFQDVKWDIKSEIELQGEILHPLYTTCLINNKNNEKIYTCQKDYDYANNKVIVTQLNAKGQQVLKRAFPIRANTTDFATIVFFLRPIIDDLVDGKTFRFYMISSEPAVYKVKAEFWDEEILEVGDQKIETIKIRVTADKGLLNAFLGKLIPVSFLWYSKKPPHVWLKYEGLESGRNSPQIITTVESITPLP